MPEPDPHDFSMIVAFGTDMGNSEDAAMTFSETAAEAIGLQCEAVELNQVDVADLQSASHFIVVCSTFGEGEFPDNALLFWEALSADAAQRLEHLSFAVLALGDTSYDLFCNAGKLLDERLEALGATRLTERVDVDGFYEQPAAAWTTDVVKLLQEARSGGDTAVVTEPPREPAAPASAPRDRHLPVDARLTVNRRLNSVASDKEVRHYEIDLAGTGFDYRAGDSIAVHATNDPELVERLLVQLGVDADYAVADHDAPLGALLTEHYEIRTPSRALQEVAGAAAYGEDVLDVIRRTDLGVDAVIDTLRPLQFRDYSIASSPVVHPDRVHLTVATVRYDAPDRTHGGVASTYLAQRCETLKVHLRPNNSFRLPGPDVPIIMIGPGTGIAPFRAFLQERRATRATGPSWLFFGDRRRDTDYLYGSELDEFAASGTLTRLDLAFSRDSPDGSKVYVQHRMLERADEFFAWLQDGAYVYVCGDEKRMSKDVDETLRRIIGEAGGMDGDTAHGYVNDLIRSHRYVRDVY